jgi:hypothetical protein
MSAGKQSYTNMSGHVKYHNNAQEKSKHKNSTIDIKRSTSFSIYPIYTKTTTDLHSKVHSCKLANQPRKRDPPTRNRPEINPIDAFNQGMKSSPFHHYATPSSCEIQTVEITQTRVISSHVQWSLEIDLTLWYGKTNNKIFTNGNRG